jgi:protein TonB
MEFLLTDPHSEADQATSPDPQSAADPVTPQETTALTEDSSPVAPSPSPSTQSASAEVVQHHLLSKPSNIPQTVQHGTPAAPAQHATDLSSATSDPVPIGSPMPLERQIETVDPVTESYRTAAVPPSEAEASPAMETIAKSVHDHAELSPHVPPDLSQSRTETTADAAPSSSIAPPADPAPISNSSAASSGSPASSLADMVAMNHPAMTRTLPAKSQYGWLAELIRRRVMSLQTYPRSAQGWEGIVVVKTTISSDGSLIDAVVTKSSGYGALDEDALQLMHRVCPVHLPQDLGKSQIAVLIPIHYKYER